MWRTIASYLPFPQIAIVRNTTSPAASVYTDTDSGLDVVAMPKPSGLGYRFSTLSTSQSPISEDEEAQSPVTETWNKFDIFSFAKSGYGCATSFGPSPGQVRMSFAFKADFFTTNTDVTRMIPLKTQDWGDLYWYAFSPYGDHAYAAWDMKAKLASWSFHGPMYLSPTTPSYSSLTQWLRNNVPHERIALSRSSLVFGSGASYFVKSENRCAWHDLPDELDQHLRDNGAATSKDGKVESIPRLIALGANGDYLAIMKNGDHWWSLNKNHFLRLKLAEETDLSTWQTIALNPYNDRDYFLAKNDGSVHLSYEELDPTATTTLSETIFHYMQAKAKEDKRQYEVQINAGDKMARISITPASNYGGFVMVDEHGKPDVSGSKVEVRSVKL